MEQKKSLATNTKRKKRLILICCLVGGVAAVGLAVGLGVGLTQCQPTPSIVLSCDTDKMSPSDNRSIAISVVYQNVESSDINLDITTEPEVNYQSYFAPILLDSSTDKINLNLQDSVTAIPSSFKISIKCYYETTHSNAITINVANGVKFDTLFDTTNFNYGDLDKPQIPPPTSVLNYALLSENNPKLPTDFMASNFTMLSKAGNAYVFDVPNEIDGIDYYGDIALTYDVNKKPTLKSVIPSTYLAKTYKFDYKPIHIEDIALALFDLNFYNQYRYIYFTSDLQISQYGESNHSVTISVISSSTRYDSTTDSAVTFPNVSWGGS